MQLLIGLQSTQNLFIIYTLDCYLRVLLFPFLMSALIASDYFYLQSLNLKEAEGWLALFLFIDPLPNTISKDF